MKPEELIMLYRVLCNFALRHLQWIVAREVVPGRPEMVAGPFVEERVANMHCAALNHEAERRAQSKRNPLARFLLLDRLVKLGWVGKAPELFIPQGVGMTAALSARRGRAH